jgi:hypothetical protein
MATTTKTKTRKTRSSSKNSGNGQNGTDAPRRRGPKKMTDSHKAALAKGRAEGRAIRDYLETLNTYKPKRGRRMSSDRIQQRLKEISDKFDNASLAVQVQLTQERINLLEKLSTVDSRGGLKGTEKEFIKYAKGYSQRKGISYTAWRKMGVPAEVLRKAGISR